MSSPDSVVSTSPLGGSIGSPNSQHSSATNGHGQQQQPQLGNNGNLLNSSGGVIDFPAGLDAFSFTSAFPGFIRLFYFLSSSTLPILKSSLSLVFRLFFLFPLFPLLSFLSLTLSSPFLLF